MRKNNLSKAFFKMMIVTIALMAGNLRAQNKLSYAQIEKSIDLAYFKAYPACVKLYAYDTLKKQQAGGVFSGVVVSKDGYILTAAHVASPGTIYQVNFPDGNSCLATGLGKIELQQDKTIPDAAMLRIITPGVWPFAAIGKSSSLKKNDPCLSISYPESLDRSTPVLRFGFVTEEKNDRGFIKTTCIMEPGDSGGPLFDCEGNVIGLHSAIERSEGSNYDVPIDLYVNYWTALSKPIIYTAYPEVMDQVFIKQYTVQFPPLTAISKQKEDKGFILNYPDCVVTIKSRVNGAVQQVSGTLFSIPFPQTQIKLNREIIVSKSSLVGSGSVIIKAHQKNVLARVIVRDKDNDLVILAPEADLKGGINYAASKRANNLSMSAGKFLLSLRPDSAGIPSISGTNAFSMPKRINAAFIGLGFKTRQTPLIISYIFPNLNQSIYRVKVGDELISVNTDTSSNLKDLSEHLAYFWPGDTVNLKLKRAGTIISENIVLDAMPQRHTNHPAEFFAGGKSARRDGFNHVFTHDAVLKPDQCGGPVFDLQGNFCGINIARYSRAICLAIPAELVYQFINTSLSKK